MSSYPQDKISTSNIEDNSSKLNMMDNKDNLSNYNTQKHLNNAKEILRQVSYLHLVNHIKNINKLPK